jgi:hypothetical protein
MDLVVAYRIYPGISKVPFFESQDKFRLSEICLRSFKRSLGSLKVKVYALLDGCPVEYEDLFKKYFTPDELVILKFDRVGNLPTFEKQIELLLDQSESEWVYFAEDDYFYLPNSMEIALNWARSQVDVDFATLYDHPDYSELELHRYGREFRQSGKYRWQTVSSGCLTFLARTTALRETRAQLLTYSKGNPDASTWIGLTHLGIWNPFRIIKYYFTSWLFFSIAVRAWQYGFFRILFGKRYRLWTPQPTLATHMESTRMALGVNWSKEIRDQM